MKHDYFTVTKSGDADPRDGASREAAAAAVNALRAKLKEHRGCFSEWEEVIAYANVLGLIHVAMCKRYGAEFSEHFDLLLMHNASPGPRTEA